MPFLYNTINITSSAYDLPLSTYLTPFSLYHLYMSLFTYLLITRTQSPIHSINSPSESYPTTLVIASPISTF